MKISSSHIELVTVQCHGRERSTWERLTQDFTEGHRILNFSFTSVSGTIVVLLLLGGTVGLVYWLLFLDGSLGHGEEHHRRERATRGGRHAFSMRNADAASALSAGEGDTALSPAPSSFDRVYTSTYRYSNSAHSNPSADEHSRRGEPPTDYTYPYRREHDGVNLSYKYEEGNRELLALDDADGSEPLARGSALGR